MAVGAGDIFMTTDERVKTMIEVIADEKHVFKADSFFRITFRPDHGDELLRRGSVS